MLRGTWEAALLLTTRTSDFIFDATFGGRRMKVLSLIDEFAGGACHRAHPVAHVQHAKGVPAERAFKRIL